MGRESSLIGQGQLYIVMTPAVFFQDTWKKTYSNLEKKSFIPPKVPPPLKIEFYDVQSNLFSRPLI